MTHAEPLIADNPETSEPFLRSPLMLIGKTRRGCWAVRDQAGQLGGLFVSHAAAFRFALSENGGRAQAILMVAGYLELDMSASRKCAANDSGPRAINEPGL